MLPSVLRWNAPVNAAQQALVSGQRAGEPAADVLVRRPADYRCGPGAGAFGRAGEPAADVLADFIARLGQPGNLRAVGIAGDQLDIVAKGSVGNMMVRSNPRPITDAAQVREILDRRGRSAGRGGGGGMAW